MATDSDAAPQVGSLDYLMLYAVDVPGVVAFYRDILGATPIEEAYPHWARVRLANIDVAFHASEGDGAESGAPTPTLPREGGGGQSGGGGGPSGGQPVFRVADIAAVRAHLEARGVEVGAYHDVPGAAVFDFADPAGNVLGVIQWGTSVEDLARRAAEG